MELKKLILFLLFFKSFLLFSQTPEEQRFLDTLKTGGLYIIGKSMPDFKFHSITGDTYSGKKLKNKITFVNLWFEACAPCIAEMEPLNNLYTTFSKSKEFQMLSVTFEKKGTILRIIKKYKIKYPQISTSQDSCYIVNFRKGFPTNMIIDKKGKVAYFTFGGATDPDKAKEDFEKNIYPIVRKLLGKNDIL